MATDCSKGIKEQAGYIANALAMVGSRQVSFGNNPAKLQHSALQVASTAVVMFLTTRNFPNIQVDQ
jgi:hypothetical protein